MCLLGLAFAAGPSIAKSGTSRAVVVGVNLVPGTSAPALAGATNDARLLASALQKEGFEVTTLLDGQATRQAVLDTLKKQGSGGSLVVYFAGYGSGPDTPTLLTSDTREANGRLEGGLPVSELDKAVVALPFEQKSVILDAGFAPSNSQSKGLRSRFYVPSGSRDVAVKVDGEALPGISPDAIHYLMASRYNEQALEGPIQGVQQGVFSFYLAKHLPDVAPQMKVSSGVVETAQDQQHPSFPAEWSGLGGPKAPLREEDEFLARMGAEPPKAAGKAATTTVWNLFNLDFRDPGAVQLRVTPNRSPIKVGEFLTFETTVGREGHLVLVEHSVEGKLELVFPRDGKVESARVQPGQVVSVPPVGQKVFAGTPGRERLKAFLFSSERNAAAFLANLKNDDGIGFDQAPRLLGSRALEFVTEEEYQARMKEKGSADTSLGAVGVIESRGTPFYTSDVSFEVVR